MKNASVMEAEIHQFVHQFERKTFGLTPLLDLRKCLFFVLCGIL